MKNVILSPGELDVLKKALRFDIQERLKFSGMVARAAAEKAEEQTLLDKLEAL